MKNISKILYVAAAVLTLAACNKKADPETPGTKQPSCLCQNAGHVTGRDLQDKLASFPGDYTVCLYDGYHEFGINDFDGSLPYLIGEQECFGAWDVEFVGLIASIYGDDCVYFYDTVSHELARFNIDGAYVDYDNHRVMIPIDFHPLLGSSKGHKSCTSTVLEGCLNELFEDDCPVIFQDVISGVEYSANDYDYGSNCLIYMTEGMKDYGKVLITQQISLAPEAEVFFVDEITESKYALMINYAKFDTDRNAIIIPIKIIGQYEK